MDLICTDDGSARCPNSVVIIGGGRWARQIADVLCQLIPPSVALSVQSRHNREAMAAWVNERGWGKRIQLTSVWSAQPGVKSTAVIVANAARDHHVTVESALEAGFPVMVEKPMALTGAAAQHLAELARDRHTRLAAAQVFLFARYLENFSRLVTESGPVDMVRIDWADPSSEERYGERKQYDATLPVFADWIPHIVSILSVLLPRLPDTCKNLSVRRGGAALELELTAAGVVCFVHLERNAPRRRRILCVSTGRETLELDFSLEPGTIKRDSVTAPGDLHWHSGARPVARMLTAFLDYAAGGEPDPRLDVAPGVRACKIIDQISDKYRAVLLRWLAGRLAAGETPDDDVCYALSELLQAAGPLAADELERLTKAVLVRSACKEAAGWLQELPHSQDPASLLAAMVA